MRIFTIISFIAYLALSNIASASEITQRSLKIPAAEEKPASIYDEENRLAVAEKQIQTLLGRIEVLEHDVAQLQKQPVQNHNDAAAISANPTLETPSLPAVSNQNQQPSLESSEKQDYDSALIALKNNQFEEAEVKFAHFIATYPKSNKLSNAYFWYGETFFKRNNFETAALNYLKGYKKFPKAEKAADSLLKLAISLGSMKKNKEACSMLTKLDSEFKNRPAASMKRANDAKNKYGCR